MAQVAGFSLSLSLLAWGVLAALEKYAKHGKTIWRILALTALAASLLPIIGVEASAGTKIALSLMHVAVAAVLVPLLPRHDKIPIDRDDQIGSRQLQSSRSKNGPRRG
ncbi:hypothetical protein EJK15_63060 [Nonomuraea basaltis]|nr:hypothetical protein EJK15_63060 [Nonomuraea basaltis]